MMTFQPFTVMQASILSELPLNIFTRQLELPKAVPSLNSVCFNLQLQESDNVFKITTTKPVATESKNDEQSPVFSQTTCGQPRRASMNFTQAKELCSKIESISQYNQGDQTSIFEESGSACKIVISTDSSCSSVRSESGKLNSEGTHEGLVSKSEIVNQYPHEIITKWNESVGKNQKYFVCTHEGCNKEFTKSWNLVYHARIHTNEKPFKCTECRESFAQKGNLKRHMKTHSETALCSRKKFQCSTCLKKYTTKFNLKVHKQTKHGEELVEF